MIDDNDARQSDELAEREKAIDRGAKCNIYSLSWPLFKLEQCCCLHRVL